jgi:hypothetical protein
MIETNTSPWPKEFFDFAYIPEIDKKLETLAQMAEDEDWSYQHTTSEHPFPVLYNYMHYTYTRLAEEHKIALSEDGEACCFNTGLVTQNQEAIFSCFETNRKVEVQRWFFYGWFRQGQWELNKFPNLPDLAHYFEDPTCLVFDGRRDLRVNIEHILRDTPRDRLPEPYKSMSTYGFQTALQGAIDNAKKRVRRSYKTAIPQYYQGQVQLLLPLCLSEPQKADLALVIERHETFYRAATCLTLDMAYNNARQLARPDRDWLQP